MSKKRSDQKKCPECSSILVTNISKIKTLLYGEEVIEDKKITQCPKCGYIEKKGDSSKKINANRDNLNYKW
jgi:DNA-directed RNA polymerase subunit M/transcription elongation factor TFIIS